MSVEYRKGMCSSRGLCGGDGDGSSRPSRQSSSGNGSGAHYALCALGVGLIALGIVMIVWTVIPMDGEGAGGSASSMDNSSSSVPNDNGADDDERQDAAKSSTVAMVLVAVGAVLLLLSICLGVRNKRRARNASSVPVATGAALMDHVAGQQEDPAADPTSFSVPSYEEVVGSGDYPVRNSNLRQSTSLLPSYEDIIAAVENEGSEPPRDADSANPAPAAAAEAQAGAPEPPGLSSQPSLPARSSSRASRLLRPLRVRRHKSDKLHLKDFRLQIRTPTQNPVTIEPITPPPQYDGKMPELE